MPQRYTGWLIPILIVVIVATYIVVPGSSIPTLGSFEGRKFEVQQGLDLQGGLQVLLEADLPETTSVDLQSMEVAKQIVENRVNGLGVTEPLVQVQGTRRIVVELPGVKDPQQAIETLKQTGLLEFVHIPPGSVVPPAGTRINSDCYNPTLMDCGPDTPPEGGVPTPEPLFTPTAGASLTDTSAITDTRATPETPSETFHTIMTGVAIKNAFVNTGSGQIAVGFELSDEGSQIFAGFTSSHVDEVLAIVLDKVVISTPTINSPITGGRGDITGNFNVDAANQMVLQLKYGSLPVPLRVAQSREIGPTLGQDSVRKSAIAGIVGMVVVILFMILYYRLPGIIASLALIIYAIITFAIFKFVPITLTLPGIAGFVLSIGVAVDANILIFERLKEELRAGKTVHNAVDAGFNRAWSSIRDSNISTLITCGILYLFGSAFGASVVKGFAITLAAGVFVSLFTAIVVTRTILHLFLDRVDFSERHSWFGI